MIFRNLFVLLSIILPFFVYVSSTVLPGILWIYGLLIPLIILGYTDLLQKRHSIKRNFPIIGHLRYILEKVRPEIMQYFVETDTEGRPINRIFRSIIYQRSKNVNDTAPFGTQMDVYETGYEWMEHTIYAKSVSKDSMLPRVIIGGPDCRQPYSASLLNISAMSYGALSSNAILALNKGAKMGNFALP
jgi:glutamate synthase domain-containing protein 2